MNTCFICLSLDVKRKIHKNHKKITHFETHLVLPHAREQLSVLVAGGKRLDWDEMVSDAADGSASNTSEEVSGPAEDKVRDTANTAIDQVTKALAESVVKELPLGKSLLARLHGVWNVCLTLENVVGLRMVDSVRTLPGEIWHEEGGVEDVTNGVLEQPVV